MLANEDPDFAEVDGQEAAAEVLMYAMAMAADRKAAPRDDIVTRLLQADKDGRGLNDDEYGLRRPLHLQHPARPEPPRGVRWINGIKELQVAYR